MNNKLSPRVIPWAKLCNAFGVKNSSSVTASVAGGFVAFMLNQPQFPSGTHPLRVVVLTSSPTRCTRATLKLPQHLIQSSFYQTCEIFNILCRRVEGCHKPDFGRFLVPNVEEVFLLKQRHIFLWHERKDAVCLHLLRDL
jgi:hypothetical protein